MCWDTDEIILDLFVTFAFPFVFSENRILIPSWQSLSNASFKWCRQRVLSLKFSLTSGWRDMKFSWFRVCWHKTSKISFCKCLESSSDVTCWLRWLPKVNKTNKFIYTYSLYIHNADTTCSIFIFWLGYSFVTSNAYCYVCPRRTLQFIQSSTAGPTYTINTHKVTHINTSFESHSPPYLITGN